MYTSFAIELIDAVTLNVMFAAYDSFLIDSLVATNGFEPDHAKRQELQLLDAGLVTMPHLILLPKHDYIDLVGCAHVSIITLTLCADAGVSAMKPSK